MTQQPPTPADQQQPENETPEEKRLRQFREMWNAPKVDDEEDEDFAHWCKLFAQGKFDRR